MYSQLHIQDKRKQSSEHQLRQFISIIKVHSISAKSHSNRMLISLCFTEKKNIYLNLEVKVYTSLEICKIHHNLNLSFQF